MIKYMENFKVGIQHGLRLEGKVAIVTGGASGIGEATAKLFAEHGARIVIADIQDELGLQVVESIGADKASYRHCDVSDEKQFEGTVTFAVKKYGALDIMFSNAGILNFGSALDMDMISVYDRTMAVNARSCALAVKHAGRVMVDKNMRGSIICTSSIESVLAGSASLAYIASKHAVLGIVKAGARELGKYGIRVNSAGATPLVCKSVGWDADSVGKVINEKGNLKGVTLTTEQVAQAALFLASDESAYVSGHNLSVDGGLSTMLKLGLLEHEYVCKNKCQSLAISVKVTRPSPLYIKDWARAQEITDSFDIHFNFQSFFDILSSLSLLCTETLTALSWRSGSECISTWYQSRDPCRSEHKQSCDTTLEVFRLSYEYRLVISKFRVFF